MKQINPHYQNGLDLVGHSARKNDMFTIPNTAFGLLTLIIVTLAGVVARLYADNKSLQTRYDVLQEARLKDATDMVDKVTIPLSSLSQTMPLIFEKLKSSKDWQS